MSGRTHFRTDAELPERYDASRQLVARYTHTTHQLGRCLSHHIQPSRPRGMCFFFFEKPSQVCLLTNTHTIQAPPAWQGGMNTTYRLGTKGAGAVIVELMTISNWTSANTVWNVIGTIKYSFRLSNLRSLPLTHL